LKQQKRYPEAQTLYQQTLDGLRRSVGLNHPSMAGTAYDLGAVFALDGKRDAAFQNLTFAAEHALSDELRQGIETDADLSGLHGDARFAALVAAAKQKPK
jgi:hypothetical protein